MRLLWSKNNKIGSYLIRWGTEGECSHFAVEFDDCFVLQSNMKQGVNALSSNEFFRDNDLVYSINYDLTLEQEEQVWKVLVKKLAGKTSWDFMAALFWLKEIIMHRITGRPIAKINSWGDPNKMMCIELAVELPDWIFAGYKIENIDLMSPQNLFDVLDSINKKEN
jgi:hypothetical protein